MQELPLKNRNFTIIINFTYIAFISLTFLGAYCLLLPFTKVPSSFLLKGSFGRS